MSAFFVFQKYEWFLPAHGLGGFGSCQVWDIIKLMDYLTTRPDIDPKHIGMMGISLGGLLCPISRWVSWALLTPFMILVFECHYSQNF
jgi:hypothetical protein